MEEGVLQLLYLRQFHLMGGLASPQTHQALGQKHLEHTRVNGPPIPIVYKYSQLVPFLLGLSRLGEVLETLVWAAILRSGRGSAAPGALS